MTTDTGHFSEWSRRGVILPVTLLVLLLLGVIAGSASFYVHADLSAAQSMSLRLQSRLAAEAGLQKVMLKLRTEQADMSQWYHNPEEYHRVLVWGLGVLEEEIGLPEEFDDDDLSPRFRFSIVADNPEDDEILVRYGVTDESSKLNINVATRMQLVALIAPFIDEDAEVTVDDLADGLLDWRDADDMPLPFGAESEFYARLEPPYAVKNAAFDTVEELLLVRGFTGELLYGEDYDRNGLMSPNEDDGALSFPPDDADAKLNRGLYPYVTVYSRTLERSADNRPRAYLFGDQTVIADRLEDVVDDPAKIAFVTQAASGQPRITSPAELLKPRTEGGGNNQQQRGQAQPGQQGQPSQQQQEQQQQTEVPSPLTVEDMVWVMDLLTASETGETVGLISINTAGAKVLATLPGLTDEDVAELIAARAELEPEALRSSGWAAAVLGAEKFVAIAPLITSRGIRFHVESMGYADHVGTVARLETILEMRGPVAQIVYNRDITMLGTAYPIHYAEGDPELVGFNR